MKTIQKAGLSRRTLVSLVLDAFGSENHLKGGALAQNLAFSMVHDAFGSCLINSFLSF